MNDQKTRVVVLGSTGSIGVNTLDVIDRHPDRFEVFALTASTSVELMLAQCARHRPVFAVMASEDHGKELQQRCRAEGLSTAVLWGTEALETVAGHDLADAVIFDIILVHEVGRVTGDS